MLCTEIDVMINNRVANKSKAVHKHCKILLQSCQSTIQYEMNIAHMYTTPRECEVFYSIRMLQQQQPRFEMQLQPEHVDS